MPVCRKSRREYSINRRAKGAPRERDNDSSSTPARRRLDYDNVRVNFARGIYDFARRSFFFSSLASSSPRSA